MAVDFSLVQDLVPEERVKTMQKIIDDLKKSIQEKQKEIQQAEQDIKTAETILLKSDEEQRIFEQKKEKEENLEQKTKEKNWEKLEQIVSTAPIKEVIQEIAQKPIDQLYGELHQIYEKEKQTGIETQQNRNILYAIRKGIEEKKQDIQEGTYRPTEKARHLMSAVEQMAETMYHSTAIMYKNG